MTSKVFLFQNLYWQYCSDVKHKNGIWTGWVENGYWFLYFDENTNIFKACFDARSVNDPVTIWNGAELVWACDPDLINIKKSDYNGVIQDAETRYKNGEPANYESAVKQVAKQVDKEYELYLKLREKYDPYENDIAF